MQAILLVLLFAYSAQSFYIDEYSSSPAAVIQSDIAKNQKNANIDTGYWKKWPNGVIPYMIHKDIPIQFQPLIQTSMDLIQNQTENCIQFVPYNKKMHKNSNWLHILDAGSGCWSYIGMGIGEQWLSLTWGCYFQSTIVHELLHTIGFWHEQSRPDRDDYVTINWDNIMEGNQDEFKKQSDSIDTLDMPYDVYSIMHYRYNTFAIDTSVPTIIPKDPSVNMLELGTREDLSDGDVAKILKYYNCNKLSPLS